MQQIFTNYKCLNILLITDHLPLRKKMNYLTELLLFHLVDANVDSQPSQYELISVNSSFHVPLHTIKVIRNSGKMK